MSIASKVVARLSPIAIISTHSLPSFSWTTVGPLPSAGEQHPWSSFDATGDLRTFIATERARRRCFIFGEQHQQPRVLAAQLTVLDELLKPSDVMARASILVLEHFNVMQQPMLDAFTASRETESEQEAAEKLIEAYDADGDEGFDLSHYMPLLLLARSAALRILAGFPPRSWARTLAREGLTPELRATLERTGFERWDDLTCSPEHRAYILSLIRNEQPDVKPDDPPATTGVVPAQVLKDAVMANSVDRALDATTGIVLVVCGSGHCEYGFGVPERVKRADVSYIVTKPNDEAIWRGQGWGEASGRPIADAVVLYDAI